ncbi:MAG: cell wall-binding repeat-containing protein, partial [Butyrivibrio sp.]|nr:cell wall-binding repeat-containing protein [Butyrivibrio sp.]
EKGVRTITATADMGEDFISVSGETVFTETITEEIPAKGHDYGDPVYTWNEDNSEVTATRTCKNDPTHVETETVKTTAKVTKEATCEEKGETTYTAEFKNEAFEKQTKVVANIDPIGHAWEEPTYIWSDDYKSATATKVCKNDPAHNIVETVETTSKVVKNPTCTENGETVYYATFTNPVFLPQYILVDNIPATGHDWEEPTYKWAEDYTSVTATRVCKKDSQHVETETVSTVAEITKAATCLESGQTTYTATFKNEAFKKQTLTITNIDPIGHKWGEPEWTWTEEKDGTVTAVAKFVCENDPSHTYEEEGKVTSVVKGNVVVHDAIATGPDGKEYTDTLKLLRKDVLRIFGSNRYGTSMKVSDFLTELLDTEKYEHVVLTTGLNFPDALSGAYLANTLDAPILLIRGDETTIAEVQKYIQQHLTADGEIFVLGGVNAVEEDWLGDLDDKFTVTRVRGDNRYLTNLDILNKVDYRGGDILVCTGREYADSLSGSAVDMPILLVKDALTAEQKEFLSSIKGAKFHIVGGTAAVSSAVEKELANYGEIVERFAGANRYETSTLLAKKFFNNAKQAVLAYGVNFPDGLCGGVIAAKMDAPLIVTVSDNRKSFAVNFCKERSITSGIVLGGSGLIDDATTRQIFAMKAGDEIVIYEHE